MATSSESRIMSGSELKYLLTFGLGVAAFWLSGRLAAAIPTGWLAKAPALAGTITLTAAALTMGLLAAAWFAVILGRNRNLRAVFIPAAAVTILAVIVALTLTRGSIGLIHTTNDLVLVLAGLNLVHGLVFALSLWLAQRLSR